MSRMIRRLIWPLPSFTVLCLEDFFILVELPLFLSDFPHEEKRKSQTGPVLNNADDQP